MLRPISSAGLGPEQTLVPRASTRESKAAGGLPDSKPRAPDGRPGSLGASRPAAATASHAELLAACRLSAQVQPRGTGFTFTNHLLNPFFLHNVCVH